ncbi:MAG: thiamine pyrophosphate-binding protein, partial [Oleiphilaceae bacterium]|nr:thiamine pyrophosphate-binding protein [Oleiphilaceae bacterium]
MSSLSMTQSLPSKEQDLALNEASTVSDQVCDVIAQHGVQQVFMVPGGFVDNFAQSIAHHHSLSAIVCASEAGAAYMADGYARASGKFGVCMGISGPGASNMITGLSLSTADQIPVLAITGEPPLSWRDRDAIQDPGSAGLRSIDLLKQVCVAQYQLFDANILDNIIQRSLNALNSGKRGAVHLSISMDIQASTPVKQAPPIMPAMHRPADYQALDQVIHALSQHKKCVLLAGAGVRHSDASAALIDFAEASGIPVATTMSAKGDFPEHHPLALGVFGWAGTHLANTLLMGDDIECLIVVGSKLGQIATMGWHEQLAKRCLIHIDAHADHL